MLNLTIKDDLDSFGQISLQTVCNEDKNKPTKCTN